MRVTSAAPALLALALLVGAAGCSDDQDEDVTSVQPPATTTSSEPLSSQPAATSSAIPEASVTNFSAGTRPDDGGHGSGNGLGVTGVRTARHSGYDRVVFDLGGTGTPGWYATYTADPRQEGSGDPVTIEGKAVLMIVLRGVGMPFDTGVAPYGDNTTRVPGMGASGITEVAPGGVFEGEQQAFIGLTGSKRPFRVFALDNPTRLVVDVSHG